MLVGFHAALKNASPSLFFPLSPHLFLGQEVSPDGRKDSADEDSERELDINFPETPETCLQMNLVYQEIIEEKIEEVIILLSQNKEEQVSSCFLSSSVLRICQSPSVWGWGESSI